MKIGLYSITYRGVWYQGGAVDVFSLVRLAKEQGWEGLELDAERPHAAPMDLSSDDRRRLRDLAGELGLPICAVSPNCDLSSPVPVQREAMICYTRECIKLAHDLGAPICKIFAAWRGITLYEGIAAYDDTYGYNQYGYWKGDRRAFVLEALRELAQFAEDRGIVLAMQNHGPDVVNRYQDVLSLIDEVGSPAFKACMDINIEPEAESAEHARAMAAASGRHQVHSGNPYPGGSASLLLVRILIRFSCARFVFTVPKLATPLTRLSLARICGPVIRCPSVRSTSTISAWEGDRSHVLFFSLSAWDDCSEDSGPMSLLWGP
jgi:sugar phosphate isomerase/epimerase